MHAEDAMVSLCTPTPFFFHFTDTQSFLKWLLFYSDDSRRPHRDLGARFPQRRVVVVLLVVVLVLVRRRRRGQISARSVISYSFILFYFYFYFLFFWGGALWGNRNDSQRYAESEDNLLL